MNDFERQIREIQERNNRVESDKAWETSWTRRLTIAVLTYVIALIFLRLIHSEDFLFNAAVPALGYLLSTLSLPWAKRWWIGRRSHRSIIES